MQLRTPFPANAIAVALTCFTGADGAAVEPSPEPQSLTGQLAAADHQCQHDSTFVSLFDGKTLMGWQAADMTWSTLR